MGGINPNLNDCSRSDMERLCPYSSASSDDEEVTSITLLRFAIGGVRRIKYLLSKCTHGVDPLWASSAAEGMCMSHAGNPTSQNVHGDPSLWSCTFDFCHTASSPHNAGTHQVDTRPLNTGRGFNNKI